MRPSDLWLLKDRASHATAWMRVAPGVRFKVASFWSEDYQKASKGLRAEDEDGAIDAIARYLFLDFEGLDGDDGKPLPNTFENRRDLIAKYIGIGQRIIAFSSEPENFVAANHEEELGN